MIIYVVTELTKFFEPDYEIDTKVEVFADENEAKTAFDKLCTEAKGYTCLEGGEVTSEDGGFTLESNGNSVIITLTEQGVNVSHFEQFANDEAESRVRSLIDPEDGEEDYQNLSDDVISRAIEVAQAKFDGDDELFAYDYASDLAREALDEAIEEED